MNPTQVPSTALSEGVPRPEIVAQRSRWTAGRIAALVIGTLLILVALALLGAGGTALWADRVQRDDGYVTTEVHEFSSAGSALVTENTDLGSAGFGWLYSPSLLDRIRIRVMPDRPGPPLFVGIGPSSDVERYLTGVNHTLISGFFEDKTEVVAGGSLDAPPGAQDFWVAKATGPGAQTLHWDPTDGSWTVVVMNADGRPGIAVGADLGATMPALKWVGAGVLAAGGVLLLGGVLLIAGAIRSRRSDRARAV